MKESNISLLKLKHVHKKTYISWKTNMTKKGSLGEKIPKIENSMFGARIIQTTSQKFNKALKFFS